MRANKFRRDGQAKPCASRARRPLESLEQMGLGFFGHARPRIGHFYHGDASFASSGYTNLILGGVARAERFECLHRIGRTIDQHAEELIVISFDCETGPDCDDEPDRKVESEGVWVMIVID